MNMNIMNMNMDMNMNIYPMTKKSSQSEVTIPINCDPIYPLHGAILILL